MENTVFDPQLNMYLTNLERRIIWLDSEITSDTLQIVQHIVNWNINDAGIVESKRQPIKLCFYSEGGDLNVTTSLIDVITLSKTPIYGFNMGHCESGAAFAFLACHKRFMFEKAYFMFHEGSACIADTFGSMNRFMLHYQEQILDLVGYITERTSYTLDEVANAIGADWYVDGEEAVLKGVCHSIIKDIDIFI